MENQLFNNLPRR